MPSDDVSVTIPDNSSPLRISFNGGGADEMVRMIELKIISDDVRPGIGSSFCTQP